MPKNKFEEFVEKLQQEIVDKEIEDFNEHIVELFHNPLNWGKPPDEEITVSHSVKGLRGDTMYFFLKINNGLIEKANFVADGCGATIATASQTTILIKGKSIKFAENLKPDEIEKALGGLPPNHKYSAELAVKTLKKLIIKYRNKIN